MELSHETIIKCQKGDRSAQHTVYLAYSPKMFGVCLRYAPNYNLAQDILQDGFIKVFNNIHSFNFKGSIEGWIRKIIVNTALEYIRKKNENSIIDISTLKAQPILEDYHQSDYNFLLSLVALLPEQYRIVFNLYALEGYSHAEIGELLKITESTSKSNYSRAKAILRKKLESLQEIDLQHVF